MARTEKVTVTYETLLCDGLRENNAAGEIFNYTGSDKDEPFRVKVIRKTSTIVQDGRGRNWRDSGSETEDVVELTLEEAANLAKSIVNDIGYAARVAEKRVLIPEPQKPPWPETDEEKVQYADWQYEVGNNDTALGFRDWLKAKEEQDYFDEAIKDDKDGEEE